MNPKIILHMPHSATNIPIEEGYLLDNAILQQEILKLTDWHTDDLFGAENGIQVKAEFSRIFCDVERFSEDEAEVMSQFGMGALYEKSDLGKPMREVNEDLRARILKEYYWPHHQKLQAAVEEQLHQFGKALILDCHSFPDIPFHRDLNQDQNRPDFNIGRDEFHTPDELTHQSAIFLSEMGEGYEVGIDWPYSGSLVPLEYYRKDKRVKSIMLEINRKLYLKEGTNEKSTNYDKIKQEVGSYVGMLQEWLIDDSDW